MSTHHNFTESPTDPNRCASCNRSLRSLRGQKKRLKSDAECTKYSVKVGKVLKLGDVVCNYCRLIVYKSRNAKTQNNKSATESTRGTESSQEPTDVLEFSQSSPQQADPYWELDVETNISSSSSESSSPQSLHPIISPESSTVNVSQSSTSDPHTQASTDVELVELPFPCVVSTHRHCFLCCSSKQIIPVPPPARIQVFLNKKIFVPKENRCCPNHLLKEKFYIEDLNKIKIDSCTSVVEVSDLTDFMNKLSSNCKLEWEHWIGDDILSDPRLEALTGYSLENLDELCGKMKSMRNSKTSTVLQALVTFLFKMRTGSSNGIVASVLGLEREQVSDYCAEVINSFEKDILPEGFGYFTKTREDLVNDQTSETVRKLYDLTDQLVLIFDGTYIRHETSSKNCYQKKSYSGQEKAPLYKPFTICTTNGYVLEMEGPFYTNHNDAEIMKIILDKPDGLGKILKPGDICVVDRGFQGVVKDLQKRGYRVFMPALKGQRSRLTTEESNDSQCVNKVRWVVEAVHGLLSHKYKLLHHTLNNKMLPDVNSLFRIAYYLNNSFGKKLNCDVGIQDEIIEQMKSRCSVENSLEREVELEHWNRRKSQLHQLTSSDLHDFPELTDQELKILFTGSYQLSQAVSYLAEMMDADGNITLNYLKKNSESNSIIQIAVKSRHNKRKTHKCYIDYVRNSQGSSGIRHSFCNCPNGRRTVGCCSHIAALIYYLSHARYFSKIIRPVVILTGIFDVEEVIAVINSDSDED